MYGDGVRAFGGYTAANLRRRGRRSNQGYDKDQKNSFEIPNYMHSALPLDLLMRVEHFAINSGVRVNQRFDNG
jgi:hypothetical protein